MRVATSRPPRSARCTLLLLVPALLLACGGGAPKPAVFCVDIQGSADLNFYDGQPHVVAVYIYPLRSSGDFLRLSIDELLGGETAPGIEPPRQLTVGPSERVPFQETFPPMVTQVGIVADYYRRPGDPEGTRKQVLPAAQCRKASVMLTASDLIVQHQ